MLNYFIFFKNTQYLYIKKRNMNVIIIVSVDNNWGIGNKGNLLYRLHEDMINFRNETLGNIVIMGRKTYESIGKPLKNRINIVISRNQSLKSNNENLIYVYDLNDALQISEKIAKDRGIEKIFIIGGESIYSQALSKGIVDKIYLTRVKKETNNVDTFFPKLDYYNEWEIYDIVTKRERNIDYDICKIRKKS